MAEQGSRNVQKFHGFLGGAEGTSSAMNVLSVPRILADNNVKTGETKTFAYDNTQSVDEDDLLKPRTLMQRLECPFTWESPILDQHEADIEEDRIPLAVRPWDSIIKKCHLAYSALKRGCVQKSQQLITECFMPLLEVPGLETVCDLTIIYRQAMRHVLDGTSAFIRHSTCEDQKSITDLDDFVKSIPSLDSMDCKQQAAIHAIRSKLSSHPVNQLWAKLAIELSPKEGQWHSYLAETLFFADQSGLNKYHDEEKDRDILFNDVLKHNSEAMTLRRDAPEPFLLMAHLLVGFADQKSSNDSYMLVQNALKKFPESAFVHEKAADLLQLSQPSFNFLPKSYLLIEPFYKKALKLAGGEVLSLKHKLGLHQVSFGRLKIENYEGTYDEGVENLKQAATLISSAQVQLDDLSKGKLVVSPLIAELPPMLVRYEEDSSSSEDSHVSHKASKKKSRRRHKNKK